MSYTLRVGQILDERFKITDLLGQGGMASVYEAIDCATGHVVALKVPHLRIESDPGFYARFQREEEIGRTLRHPSILRVFPVGERSRPYLVMERLEGKLLSEHLAQTPVLPPSEALPIAIRIAEALQYMHSLRIVHRDLKPKNILLCDDGTLRVIDLGFSKGKGFGSITLFGLTRTLGSSDYVAPEQARGWSGDERSDIYSLGALLYRMLTGSEPFPGPDPMYRLNARLVGDPVAPRTLNPRISPEVEELILHAMERNPRDRFSSVLRFRLGLLEPEGVVLTGRHERLQPARPWNVRWRRLRPALWAFVGTAAVLGILYGLSRWGGVRPS
ncbi:MAG TPA: serine/threonine-protein kinase [Planctomycetota bacterium]|nr:serine/threonine-protein kinase [Planctomycetota bacterium]